MAIDSNVIVQGTDYGILKQQKNGVSYFISFGKTTTLEEVCEDIENEDVYYHLSCEYNGKIKRASILKGELTDFPVIKTLANKGFQVSRKSFDAFVDLINLQDEDLEQNGISPTKVYTHLGWTELRNKNGGVDLHYRTHKLIGKQNGKYIGQYAVTPMGSYDEWRSMVENDVVGHSVLELVLIASLSAVTNGLIAPKTNGENPIVHLNYSSSKGKSSALILGVSTSGEPFDGTKIKPDKHGNPKEYFSLYQSWGATDAAMIATQAGNCGVVTVLNELGKNLSNNMTRLIFDLSEGSDKRRLTSSLNTRLSQRFTTVFISSGESSLLEKCKDKLEGLNVRVMEITKPITDSAEHSNRIKEVCRKNNGFASPMLAKYIIDNGGVDYVLPIYKKWKDTLNQTMPYSPSKERFIEKFAALFMATAEIASEALDIAFDIDGIQKFLIEYDKEVGHERNVALQAYKVVIEACRTHINHFHTPENVDNHPRGDVYGRICRCKNKTFNGKYIEEEFLIRNKFIETILNKDNYPNKETCLRAWDEAGLISHDNDRYTRSRQIDPHSPKEDVYVLLTFKEDDSTPQKRIPLKTFLSQKDEYKVVNSLLTDEEEGGSENGNEMVESE